MVRNCYSVRLYAHALCIVVVLFTHAGCDEIKSRVSQEWLAGTLRGYQACIEHNKKLGLTETSVDQLCQLRHVRSINPRLSGQAGYSVNEFGILEFSGSIKNESRSFVVTKIIFKVSHKDNVDKNGNPITEILVKDDFWLEPLQQARFRILNLKFQPKKDRLFKTNEKSETEFFYTWGWMDIQGLKVILN